MCPYNLWIVSIEIYGHIEYNIIKDKEQNSEESKRNTGPHGRVGPARYMVPNTTNR